ncbi:DUF6192 family protein [Streptomyces lavendulae]|uniref:DUF6192 family protein n=1 Tax=Streptomyces lavendulae TaxID=1914 RepID=UPI0036EF0525
MPTKSAASAPTVTSRSSRNCAESWKPRTGGQFAIGDYALEIEPMRERGPQDRGEELFTVKDSLFRLAEDIGLSYSAVNGARWVASRWPEQHRQAHVSFTVHRILAAISNEEERFTAILTPPGGKARWTPDDASRRVGRQVERPITPQEKVSAIHTLARDEEVAAVITGDLLRRPSVVAQVRQEDRVRAVEELTRDESVAATVTTGLLRRPDVAFQAMSDDYPDYELCLTGPVTRGNDERWRRRRGVRSRRWKTPHTLRGVP